MTQTRLILIASVVVILLILGGSIMSAQQDAVQEPVPLRGTEGLAPPTSGIGIAGNLGFVVNSVQADSPAEKAGLQQGDVILTVNDRPFVSVPDFVKFTTSESDTPVNLKIMRAESGGLQVYQVKLKTATFSKVYPTK